MPIFAADTQADAAEESARISRETTDRAAQQQAAAGDLIRQDFAPYRDIGETALNQYGALYGIGADGLLSAEDMREWRPLAEQGNVAAQNSLGVSYTKGQGVPQNHAEAVRLYCNASEQGLSGAQHNLGIMYFNGWGVPENYITAHIWFNLAAAQGYKDAIKARGIIARLMTPADISEAQRLAREWRPKKQR